MKETIIFITIVILIGLNSCSNPTSPPPPAKEQPKAVKLKLVDVSCTEAFINVTASDTVLPINITLNKDEKALFNFTLNKTDTTIIDTALQAGKSYIYQTIAIIKGEEQKSDTLQVKTLDTTSQNFSWQKYTFGNGASSIFYDCAIISENDIWCVGVVNINDSSENGHTTYNAAHWNGSTWELKRILYNGLIWEIKTSSAFNENDILFSAFVKFDGKNFIEQPIPSLLMGWGINKIWGTSINDFYAVGDSGNIAHYQNKQWSKIESGSDWNVVDIWGDKNPFTNKEEIICTLLKGLDQTGPWSDVIKINNDYTKEKLDLTGLGQVYGGIWFKAGFRYYLVGDGLYQKTNKDSKWENLNTNKRITTDFMEDIKGNGLNDIIIAGDYGEVLHYNGIYWKSFRDETRLTNGVYYRADIKGDIVAAVGWFEEHAVVLVGHHLK